MIHTMRDSYPQKGLGELCRLLGITRQAYYKHARHIRRWQIEAEIVLKEVQSIRRAHPRMGVRKLYVLLCPMLQAHGIKMGRDALFNLLAEYRLLVRPRRRAVYTTYSRHRFYKWPNLIKGYVPTASNQLYVSDITYWRIRTGFVYISLITDAYSHKIVGYHVSPTLDAVETLCALSDALHHFGDGTGHLIHHSDRGVQYCSDAYVALLQKHHVHISMTDSSEPTDNPVAERVNGILKNEYLYKYNVATLQQARKALTQAVTLYNQYRPHMSIGMMTPNSVHAFNTKTKNIWKKTCS